MKEDERYKWNEKEIEEFLHYLKTHGPGTKLTFNERGFIAWLYNLIFGY